MRPVLLTLLLLTPALADDSLIYCTLRPTNWDLYRFPRPSANPTISYPSESLDYDPAVSPDGRHLVFTSEREGRPRLFLADLTAPIEPRPFLEGAGMEDQASFAPDGSRVLYVCTRDGNAEIYSAAFMPGLKRLMLRVNRLTNHPAGDFRPALSPDGARIAFSSDRDHPPRPGAARSTEIYVMNADGSGTVRLTDTAGGNGSPIWNAKGTRIYFYSGRKGPSRIYSMNPDGSDQKPLTPEGMPAFSPRLTPAGRIAFSLQDKTGWHIHSIAPDGSGQRLESDTARDYFSAVFPAHSDGLIACGAGAPERGDRVGVLVGVAPIAVEKLPYVVAGSPAQVELPGRVLSIRAGRGAFPRFTPDGSRVLASANCPSGGLLSTSPDGVQVRTILEPKDKEGTASSPAMTRDGKWIYFSRGAFFGGTKDVSDVFRMHPDGSRLENLTGGKSGNNAMSDVSPDGKRVAFRGGRDGNFEIYITKGDGSGLQRITNHPAHDISPAFSPTGDRLAFASDRNGDYDIYMVDLKPDGKVSEPKRITQSKGTDLHPCFSPDGEWLAYTTERFGLNDEPPLVHGFNPQPYGEICAQRLSDGTVVRLTHNKWTDGIPAWFK